MDARARSWLDGTDVCGLVVAVYDRTVQVETREVPLLGVVGASKCNAPMTVVANLRKGRRL